MSLPVQQKAVTYPGQKPFIDTRNAIRKDVTLNSATVDSGNTPTTILRKGLVVGLETSAKTWIDASDALVNANLGATVSSLEAPDADWQSITITSTQSGGGHYSQVALGAADDTIAEVVIAMDADANQNLFYSHADSGAGDLLNITTLETGGDAYISVTSSLATAFAAAGTTAFGSWGQFGIVDEVIDMLGIDGSVEAKHVNIITGNCVVDESKLTSLTDDAKRALAANGVVFE